MRCEAERLTASHRAPNLALKSSPSTRQDKLRRSTSRVRGLNTRSARPSMETVCDFRRRCCRRRKLTRKSIDFTFRPTSQRLFIAF